MVLDEVGVEQVALAEVESTVFYQARSQAGARTVQVSDPLACVVVAFVDADQDRCYRLRRSQGTVRCPPEERLNGDRYTKPFEKGRQSSPFSGYRKRSSSLIRCQREATRCVSVLCFFEDRGWIMAILTS
ncbi:MAG: hypothetical protein ACK4VP_07590 [Nitrospira sp.]